MGTIDQPDYENNGSHKEAFAALAPLVEQYWQEYVLEKIPPELAFLRQELNNLRMDPYNRITVGDRDITQEDLIRDISRILNRIGFAALYPYAHIDTRTETIVNAFAKVFSSSEFWSQVKNLDPNDTENLIKLAPKLVEYAAITLKFSDLVLGYLIDYETFSYSPPVKGLVALGECMWGTRQIFLESYNDENSPPFVVVENNESLRAELNRFRMAINNLNVLPELIKIPFVSGREYITEEELLERVGKIRQIIIEIRSNVRANLNLKL